MSYYGGNFRQGQCGALWRPDIESEDRYYYVLECSHRGAHMDVKGRQFDEKRVLRPATYPSTRGRKSKHPK